MTVVATFIIVSAANPVLQPKKNVGFMIEQVYQAVDQINSGTAKVADGVNKYLCSL